MGAPTHFGRSLEEVVTVSEGGSGFGCLVECSPITTAGRADSEHGFNKDELLGL